MLQVQYFFICSCREETAKLEELQDKNVSQKEVLRDMTAKIEVWIQFISTENSRLDSPALLSPVYILAQEERRGSGAPFLAIQPLKIT